MGGLQGWHLLLLLFIAAIVIVVIVVAVTSSTKASQRNSRQVGPHGEPLLGAQVGYNMEGQPIYQQSSPPSTNVFAILALILGLVTGFFGIIFGHIALSQIKKTGQPGRGMALAGLIIGYVWLAFWVVLILGSLATHS
ncbi:DUF4190 domain-containing protein [Glutamicibacter ardleyensis]|uniref:DUF4190 domain-containing protein n=1 Tax=Glutamicibacter ardleyensis TaxID=225894 RepID=A0ABQ2DXY5_9MICC|nr:DUF4190 domain-containing protein [Glutamicibacter ardleyensis]GGJ73258.1 hypothetical protein GCM10007173_35330 [Glutamicibacter ardleyensis]